MYLRIRLKLSRKARRNRISCGIKRFPRLSGHTKAPFGKIPSPNHCPYVPSCLHVTPLHSHSGFLDVRIIEVRPCCAHALRRRGSAALQATSWYRFRRLGQGHCPKVRSYSGCPSMSGSIKASVKESACLWSLLNRRHSRTSRDAGGTLFNPPAANR